jgi:predicted permease
MKTVARLLMIANAVLFFFGAVQHAGIVVGPFHEPLIVPAAIVETLCGLSLLWGATALFRDPKARWRVALITNFVALGGVLLGIAALAAGAGPRTATNDLYHQIMLLLIGASVVILFYAQSRRPQDATGRSR